MSLRASDGNTCVSDRSIDEREEGRVTADNKETGVFGLPITHYDLWPRPHPIFKVGESAVVRSILILHVTGRTEFVYQRWTYVEAAVRQTLHGMIKGLQAKYQKNQSSKPSLHNFWFDSMGRVDEMFYHDEAAFEISSILYDPMQYPGIAAYHEYQLKDGAEKHLQLKLREFGNYLGVVRRLP